MPVPKAQAVTLASPYKLLPLPRSLFPSGFPAGTHPVLVYSGYDNDIRQTVAGVPLAIPAVVAGAASVTFVDRLGNGKTPFTLPIRNFIGGVNGQALSGLVPSKLMQRHR